MVRSDPADIVNAWWTYEFALGALASGLPVLVTVSDWAPTILRYTPDPYRLGRLLMFGLTMAKADHFAAPSPHIAHHLERWRRPCPVVGEPLDVSLLAETPRTWPGGPPRLIAVSAGFGRLKNVATLLEAFALIRRGRPDACLTLLGSDHQQNGPTARWAASRSLDRGVDFVGPVPHREVLTRVAAAHALVHPSLEESFGQAVLEACAQGTPVIGHRTGGAVPWVLRDGQAGVLTDATDPAALAASIDGLLSDPRRWETLSAAGIEAARRFSAPVVASRYYDLLAAIVENTRAASSASANAAKRGTVDP
jgi:glycosyltransferase involved in cell wall biosynthesis